MLADVAPYLRCPHCGGDLAISSTTLACRSGHRFDIARQGYANLLSVDARTGTADTAAMVAARAEFLGSGEYAAVSDAVGAATAAATPPGCVVDAGGGTGHHLSAALDRCPARLGVCCDLSGYAARRAARAHPRIGAVVADVWRELPVRDRCAAVVLNVFSPRNAAEFGRVLHPDGVLVVVTPRAGHLAELVQRLGLLSVDARKERRLDDALGERFARETTHRLRWTMRLRQDGIRVLVQMGPNAWHTDASDMHELPEPFEVTGDVTVSTYRPLPH